MLVSGVGEQGTGCKWVDANNVNAGVSRAGERELDGNTLPPGM